MSHSLARHKTAWIVMKSVNLSCTCRIVVKRVWNSSCAVVKVLFTMIKTTSLRCLNDDYTTKRQVHDLFTKATHSLRQFHDAFTISLRPSFQNFKISSRIVNVVNVVNVVDCRTKNNWHVNCFARHVSRHFTTLRFSTTSRQMIRQTIRLICR